ncbi:MAG: copper-binding protein [Candidatus Nitrotoga sp.]
MKFVSITLSVFLLAATYTFALADTHHQGEMHAAGSMTQGVVTKIGLQHKKFYLTHGPIEFLSWLGMTMVFAVKASQQKYFVTRIAQQN